MKRFTITLLSSFLFGLGLQSQEVSRLNPNVIANAGKVIQSESYTLSFTIGEMVVDHFEGGQYQLTQGFQQPEVFEVNTDKEPSSSRRQINIYPNPTKDMVAVELIIQTHVGELFFQLYNMQGQELLSRRIAGSETVFEIDLSGYPNGAYLLKVSDAISITHQVFQIIKI